jgi:salicylate biosynthesis isochorismate synthase/menaquinone-specific isochorismate synthase
VVERRTATAAAPADRRSASTRVEPLALSASATRTLSSLLTSAISRAKRRGEPTLASMTVPLPADADPSAIAVASRRAGEPWFLLEQPARDRMALAALGQACAIEADGQERFEQVAKRWRELAAAALSWGEGVEDAGPLAVGGFAFAVSGARSPAWSGFAPASLLVPEVAILRGGSGVRMTLTAVAGPDDVAQQLLARLEGRLAELRAGRMPLLDPDSVTPCVVSSAMPPEHYEAAVARAKEMIASRRVRKIVLAREVQVHAPQDHNPAAIFDVLREAFANCFVFCVGRGDAALVGASPELLVRREGQRLSTLALAGSSRRSADPAVDVHLGEQLLRSSSYREEHAIVVRRIERRLQPHAVWVAAAREPQLAQIANIQHLATPIRAQLAAPMDAIELAALLHPTPAIGGEPAAPALELIPALEGLDRGWYAGPLGWTDATGDGELFVALRCALLRGRVAHCYAGNGIVRDSDPATELAETEVKLSALLPLLAG